jgi:hypothetical protein
MNDLLHLETISALKRLAAEFERSEAVYRSDRIAPEYGVTKKKDREKLLADWKATADQKALVASQLREIVANAVRYRAYSTIRWLFRTGLEFLGDGPEESWKAIMGSPSVRKDKFERDDQCHVIRLVEYVDPTTGDTRWALDHMRTTPSGPPSFDISDNILRADAEYRYDEFRGMLEVWAS